MRESDKAEVWAASHLSPEAALAQSVACSGEALTALVSGEPVCIFGVGIYSLACPVGVPWMLGTNALGCLQMRLARQSKRIIDAWLLRFESLENYVDARQVRSIKYLRWLGFEIEEPQPWGREGLPFHKFHKRR